MGVTRAQQEAHHLLHQVVEVTVSGTPGAGRTRLHGFRGLAIERKKHKRKRAAMRKIGLEQSLDPAATLHGRTPNRLYQHCFTQGTALVRGDRVRSVG